MTYSALWFSQMQFFGSLSFMAIFFALSLALSWLLFYFRLRTLGQHYLVWLPVYRFWARLFALAYFLSLAAALPVLLQLGSLWPGLLVKIQAVSSPLLAAAILTALAVKAAFIGFMLYAKRRLRQWLHTAVVFLVALGQSTVLVLLLTLVSWMHTPSGTQWVDGHYVLTSWAQVFLNPSMLWYVLLFMSASFVLVALFMLAVLAWQSTQRALLEAERRVFALMFYVGSAAWLVLLFAFIGNGSMVESHQEAKAAAAMGQVLVAGMSPPVMLVYSSLRLAMLSGLAIGGMWLLAWRVGITQEFQLRTASLLQQRLFIAAGLLGPILLISGMAYQLFGAMPFVVAHTITISEVQAPAAELWSSVLTAFAYGVLYLALCMGFLSLVRYTARSGVITIANQR